MSKDGKVNKITKLTHRITYDEKQIECFDTLLKIIILHLNQAAIPYFKKDKISLYNDMINTYSNTMIKNSNKIAAAYGKVVNANHQTLSNKATNQSQSYATIT